MGIRSRETSGWQSLAVGGRSLGGGVGIAGEKARRRGGGLEGWPVRRRTGGGAWFRGGRASRGRRGLAVRPVVPGGSGGGV